MAVAYISLGSNNEDRVGFIQQATSLLLQTAEIRLIRSSSIYETEPVGNVTKDWFLNAVIEIKTSLSPQNLLELLQKIERKLGRNREAEVHWGNRNIDLDILFYNDLIMNEPNLVVPHKHLHNRAFVLVPMLEIDSNFVHPVSKKTISELHEALENPEDVYLYGARLDLLR